MIIVAGQAIGRVARIAAWITLIARTVQFKIAIITLAVTGIGE
jgi:hypothetical protein